MNPITMLKMKVWSLAATNCNTLLIIPDIFHTRLKVHTLPIAHKVMLLLFSILLTSHVHKARAMLLLA